MNVRIGDIHADPTGWPAQEIQVLTRATHRSRPKALLLDVLQGPREGWGIDAIVGVSPAR